MEEVETHAACAAYRAELGPSLDRALDPEIQARVARHCAECHACRAELALLRRVLQAVAALPHPTPSPGVRDRVLRQAMQDTVRSELRSLYLQKGVATMTQRREYLHQRRYDPLVANATTEARTEVPRTGSDRSTFRNITVR